MSDLSDLERLRLILKCFDFTREVLTYEAVAKQFHHETGEPLPEELFDRAFRKRQGTD